MVTIYSITLVFIAAGIAADNLVLAFISGNGIALFRATSLSQSKSKLLFSNWFLILGLLFIIQNMVLIYGQWFGLLTKGILKGNEQLMSIGILFSMGIKMYREAKIKNSLSGQVSLSIKKVLDLAFGTSIYVFAFGFTMSWLNMNHFLVNLSLLSLLILFYISGMLLGKYHFEKAFNYLNITAALLVMAGSFLLVFEQLKYNLK